MYEQWTYWAVFAVLVTASFGVPIPEDIPLLTGGFLCHTGQAQLPIMILVGVTGVLTGDVVLFFMGRRFGHHIVEHRFIRRLVKPSRLLAAEKIFAHHGVKILFVGRFLPGLRAMLFMAAGVLRVRPLVFVAVDGSAACFSVSLLVMLGYFFGGSVERIMEDLRIAKHTIVVVAVIAAVIAAAVWFHRRQKRLMAEEPVPEVGIEELANLPPVARFNSADSRTERKHEQARHESAHGVAARAEDGL